MFKIIFQVPVLLAWFASLSCLLADAWPLGATTINLQRLPVGILSAM